MRCVHGAAIVLATLALAGRAIKVPETDKPNGPLNGPAGPLLRMMDRADNATLDLSRDKTKDTLRLTMDRMLAMSGECDLCHGGQDWAFILATGRSGSTTALEMMNAIPGFYLAGENYGVMNTLMDLYNTKTTVQPKSDNHVMCALQTFVRAIIGEFDPSTTQVIGFKEIRHVEQAQLAFLKKVFPCGKYVVNTRRNLGQQHQSQFQKDIVMSDLQNWTKTLDLWTDENPADTYVLKLEDYSVDLYNGMLSFLGVDGCQFTSVAHANDAWHWNDDTEKSKNALDGTCAFHSWADKKVVEDSAALAQHRAVA